MMYSFSFLKIDLERAFGDLFFLKVGHVLFCTRHKSTELLLRNPTRKRKENRLILVFTLRSRLHEDYICILQHGHRDALTLFPFPY